MKLNENPTENQLQLLRALYEESFPAEEKKPFDLMLRKQEEGHMELLGIEDDEGEFLGLAIMILHKNIALLDYFAVCPEHREKGIGSKTLSLLKDRYPGKTLLLEIEDPEEPSDNGEERTRRKNFYLRNGMEIMPYKVWLFGVKMLILTHGVPVTFAEYHEVFEAVFPPQVGKRITLA